MKHKTFSQLNISCLVPHSGLTRFPVAAAGDVKVLPQHQEVNDVRHVVVPAQDDSHSMSVSSTRKLAGLLYTAVTHQVVGTSASAIKKKPGRPLIHCCNRSGGCYISKLHKKTGRPLIHCFIILGGCYFSKRHKKTGRFLIHCFIMLGACYFRPLLSGSFLCWDVYWTLPLFVVLLTSSSHGSHTYCFRHPWFLSKRFSRAAVLTRMKIAMTHRLINNTSHAGFSKHEHS